VVQPTRRVLSLGLLLLGTAASAQPSLARERRERAVTVTGNPADPPHEIRVAKGIVTVIFLDAPIHRDAVEVEGRGTRVKVDAGDSSVILEPLIDLGPTERLVLRAPFADGKAPAQAVFVLVAAPSEVDTRIDVVRREPPEVACQAKVMEGPLEFARAGYLDRSGIKTAVIRSHLDVSGDFESVAGVSHLGEGWLLIDVEIINRSGQPWVPEEATLTSKAGKQVKVRAMTAEPGEIAPGQRGRILVETEAPPESAGREFVLELRGRDGRSLSIPTVRLLPHQEVGKR
jgi:hypothetical protein